MKNSRTVLCLSLILFIGSIAISSATYAESIAVIVNKGNTEDIDMTKIQKIFTKEYRIWKNGKDIVPVNLKDDGGTYSAFAKDVTGKTPQQMKSYWIQQRITKNIKEPLSFKNAAKVKSFVKKVGNAIGYLPKKYVDDSVKVILEVN